MPTNHGVLVYCYSHGLQPMKFKGARLECLTLVYIRSYVQIRGRETSVEAFSRLAAPLSDTAEDDPWLHVWAQREGESNLVGTSHLILCLHSWSWKALEILPRSLFPCFPTSTPTQLSHLMGKGLSGKVFVAKIQCVHFVQPVMGKPCHTLYILPRQCRLWMD